LKSKIHRISHDRYSRFHNIASQNGAETGVAEKVGIADAALQICALRHGASCHADIHWSLEQIHFLLCLVLFLELLELVPSQSFLEPGNLLLLLYLLVYLRLLIGLNSYTCNACGCTEGCGDSEEYGYK